MLGKFVLKKSKIYILHDFKLSTFRGVFKGGAMGAKSPPGPSKSIDFRGFSGHNGC